MTKDKEPLFRRAFTLVEAMISIALALVLILAVAKIFGIAQQTIGAGTTTLTAIEKDRGAMTVFTQDMHAMVAHPNSPGMVLYSAAIPAFRTLADKVQNLAGPSTPQQMNQLNSSGTLVSSSNLSYTQPNDRIHRIDRFCFFARGEFTRQTSDSPNITSPTTSSEAFVWYGHLALPNNSLTYVGPGSTTTANDNNYYASDWILGREVILMLASPNMTTNQNYFPGPPNSATDPLSLLAPVAMSAGPDSQSIFTSRYDLAAASIDGYRIFLANANPAASLAGNNWWKGLIGYNGSSDVRYQANPFPVKPTPTAAGWMSAASAEMSPIFIKGCSQFIVEFAGDFVGQNPSTGQVTTAVPDGQMDFSVDPATGAHKVRWYGFPRDPADQGSIGVVGNIQYGVCPLRDTLTLAADYTTVYPGTLPNEAPVERMVPTQSPNYATAMAATSANVSAPYVVAWGQDTQTFPRPKMIRITFAIDDPAGHLNAAQTYSYVYNLP